MFLGPVVGGMIVALGAGDILGKKDFGHECGVIQLHVLVSEVISGGWFSCIEPEEETIS